MRIQTILQRSSLAALIASGALLVSSPVWVDAAGAQEARVFQDGPPAPDAMADMLFPDTKPRTRSVRPQDPEAPQSFGLLIQFGFDSTDIKPESRAYLDAVGEMMSLERTTGKKLVVEGHADASGPAGYNLSLSEQRARAVREYLVGKYQIDPARLVSRGKGEAQPLSNVAPTDSINRRVEFHPGR